MKINGKEINQKESTKYMTTNTPLFAIGFKDNNVGTRSPKRKIQYDKVIDCLGTYKIPIDLHKDVQAIITLYVVEGNTK